MNKQVSIGATITIATMLSAVVFSITMIFSQTIYNNRLKNMGLRTDMYEKINELDGKVNQSFIYDINKDTLIDNIASGFMNGIGDEYAKYLTIEETRKLSDELRGSLVGIGMKSRKTESGLMMVVEVWKESPAETVGLKSGDLILRVSDISVQQEYDAANAALTGNIGDVVSVTYQRDGEEHSVDITRQAITVPSVYSRIISNDIAYIRITNFHDNTPTQLEAHINSAINNKAAGIIIDVRDNPGGARESVIDCIDLITPKGTIVSFEDARGVREEIVSDDREVTLPITVLMNKSSVSSAELFAAALRDFGKAQLVGERTAGKGVLQSQIPLNDGSSIVFSTSIFYTPNGESFDKVGVSPDVEVRMSQAIYDAWKLLPFDDISPISEVDPQLTQALEVIRTEIKKVSGATKEEESSEATTPDPETSTDN